MGGMRDEMVTNPPWLTAKPTDPRAWFRFGLCLLSTFAAISISSGEADAGSLADATTSAEIFDGPSATPYELGVRAYVWGMPLVEAAKIRLYMTRPQEPGKPRAGTDASAPINHMGHAAALYDPTYRNGVGPNNDTLYVLGWLDLTDGPFVLETPDFGDRYYTFQMAGADTTTEISFGQRTHGGVLPPVFVYDSNYHGKIPAGMPLVRADTRYLLIAGRILVSGAGDLPAARRLAEQVELRPWDTYAARSDAKAMAASEQGLLSRGKGAAGDDERFLYMLGNVLADWNQCPEDAALIRSLARIGLTMRGGFQPAALGATDRRALMEGIADGRKIVERRSLHLGKNINGWTINYNGGRFGTDYLLRAAVAKDEIYVNVPEESIYPIGRSDSAGAPLDGAHRYAITFAHGEMPPVRAFWSITLYDDQGYMVANGIDRYSIGDRTAGLHYGTDGSLRLVIQHSAPTGDERANWLPSPLGRFYLMMRLYLPKGAVAKGAWVPPPITKLAD